MISGARKPSDVIDRTERSGSPSRLAIDCVDAFGSSTISSSQRLPLTIAYSSLVRASMRIGLRYYRDTVSRLKDLLRRLLGAAEVSFRPGRVVAFRRSLFRSTCNECLTWRSKATSQVKMLRLPPAFQQTRPPRCSEERVQGQSQPPPRLPLCRWSGGRRQS
jgi:hypothetical protein